MTNGMSRVEKYRHLTVEDHLRFIDNDLDANEHRIELLTRAITKKLNWILVTFVSLLVVLCGGLLTALVSLK
jgi:hypothetical protein